MRWAVTILAILAVTAQTILGLDSYPPNPVKLVSSGNNQDETRLGLKVPKRLAKLGKPDSTDKPRPDRLNGDVVPIVYKIRLDFDSNLMSCNGSVEIDFRLQRETNEIILHFLTKSLDKSSAYLTDNKKRYDVTDIQSKDSETVVLRFDKTLPTDKWWTLHLGFSYAPGLFSATFNADDDDKASTSQIAFTQLMKKSTSLLFPCFNEPSMKAQFSLQISNDMKYTALSSMPIESTEQQGTKKITIFRRSPKMSPHLLNIVVSDLKLRSTQSPMSQIWARKNRVVLDTDIAQLAAIEMESFTKIPINQSKIDHVAVPIALTSSNGERCGLILYNEEDLTSGKNSPAGAKQRIVSSISRAVASQWFGGLVTAGSWGYHWLDEGFSKFFELYLSEKVGQEAWNKFVVSELQATLSLDSNPRLSKPLTSASYSDELISVNKGASFLKMVAELLTINKFGEAVKKYVSKFAFKSVTPDDLFEILEEVYNECYTSSSKVNFRDFAKSWTEQAGFPVVNVTRNYKTDEVTLSQQRYFETKPEDGSAMNTRWWIPLSWMTAKKTVDFKSEKWLRPDSENLTFVIPSGKTSFLLNTRSVGYFRVNYDNKNWLLLAKDMENTPDRFSVANRAQIIDDAYALTKSGHVEITIALQILRLLEKEKDPFIWTTGIKVLSQIKDNVGGTDVYKVLERFIQRLITFAYSMVNGLSRNKPDENDQDKVLRSLLASLACSSGLDQCTQHASNTFEKNKDNLSSIRPNEVFTTFCGVFKRADETKFWDLRKLITTEYNQQNLNMLHALAHCTDDKPLIKAHLADLFKADGNLSKNIKLSVRAAKFVSSSPSNSESYFEFLKENIKELLRFEKGYTSQLVRSLENCAKTRSQYEKILAWVKDVYIPKSGDSHILRELEDMPKTAITWNEQHSTEMEKWINHFYPGSLTTPVTDQSTLLTDPTSYSGYPQHTTEDPSGVSSKALCKGCAFWSLPFVSAFFVLWKVIRFEKILLG